MKQYKNLNKLCQVKLKKNKFLKEFEEKVAIIAIK